MSTNLVATINWFEDESSMKDGEASQAHALSKSSIDTVNTV